MIMSCPALIYSTDSPLLPVPFTIVLDQEKVTINESSGELDVARFFKDVFVEHVYVDDGEEVIIVPDEQSDFVVTTSSRRVVMVVNLPEGVAPCDLGIIL
jgi:hypothetical protein